MGRRGYVARLFGRLPRVFQIRPRFGLAQRPHQLTEIYLPVCVFIHRRAGANEVAIPVDVVDASDRRPELVLARPGAGIGGLFPGVRAIPVSHERTARCAARSLEDCSGDPSSRFRPPLSHREWRSWRRRIDRAPPSIRSRSARSSWCPGRARTWWAHGSRNP